MAATRCRKCGERIDDSFIALCLDCMQEELDAEARVPKIDAAIEALDRMGEGGEP